MVTSKLTIINRIKLENVVRLVFNFAALNITNNVF